MREVIELNERPFSSTPPPPPLASPHMEEEAQVATLIATITTLILTIIALILTPLIKNLITSLNRSLTTDLGEEPHPVPLSPRQRARLSHPTAPEDEPPSLAPAQTV